MKAVPTHLSDFSKDQLCVFRYFLLCQWTLGLYFPSWKESLKNILKKGVYIMKIKKVRFGLNPLSL